MVDRQKVETVRSREDLSKFIEELRRSLDDGTERWENRDLSSYLEAMSGWIADMDGYYQNRGEPSPELPTWKTIAEVLAAAAIYE